MSNRFVRSPSPPILLPLAQQEEEEEENPRPLKRLKRPVVPVEEKKSFSRHNEDVVDLKQIEADANEVMSRVLDEPAAGISESKSQPDDDVIIKKVPEWRPMPVEINPFDGKDYLETEYDQEKPEYSEYCFFCWCQMTRSDFIENTRYKYLHSFVVRNWGKTNAIWLMNRTQDLYNNTVRKYCKRDWPFYRRNIFEHFISHDLTPRFVLEFQEMCFRSILRQMMRGGDLFEQNIDNPALVRCKQSGIRAFRETAQYHRKIHEDVVEYRK